MYKRTSVFGQDQLTLGDLIEKITPIANNQDGVVDIYEIEATVEFDFEYLFPTELHSWRGAHEELAFSYKSQDGDSEPMGVTAFLKMLTEAVDEPMYGWKGGYFKMSSDTPLWVANPRNSGRTAVVGVKNNEYEVLLLTAYCEY